MHSILLSSCLPSPSYITHLTLFRTRFDPLFEFVYLYFWDRQRYRFWLINITIFFRKVILGAS